PANLVPLVRLLRQSLGEPKDRPVRTRALALLARQSGTDFGKPKEAIDPAALRAAYQPVFAWFEQAHPDLAAAARGGAADAARYIEVLKTVPWERGDAGRGAALFRKQACATCHAGTSKLGPDLTGVAGRFSRDDLFAAIYDPSR